MARLRYNRFPELGNILNWTSPQFSFRRRLFDLITTPGDLRVREQLLRMHSEIDHADQILRDGLRVLRGYLATPGPGLVTEPASAPECVVEELSRPLTNAAMAAVTY